ncbi:MAG: hypothetical protein JSU75_04520 [Gammaproteobacteria bacterium]|nr:MAG: hypothetical protein JSU75_04520 [Gammaproteobacteria bacterium]
MASWLPSRLAVCQFFFYHFFEPVSAINYLAMAGMPAAKFKILDLVVFHIQHAHQGNLFLFTVRAGLFEQCDCILTLDKPLYRKRSDMIKIIVSQTSWVMAGHDIGVRVLLVDSFCGTLCFF